MVFPDLILPPLGQSALRAPRLVRYFARVRPAGPAMVELRFGARPHGTAADSYYVTDACAPRSAERHIERTASEVPILQVESEEAGCSVARWHVPARA